MAVMYVCLVFLQLRPQTLAGLRRWSYAGFYLDEIYTRLALRLWATRWARLAAHPHGHATSDATAGLVSP
ncbi:MAG: hypothetical protein HIU89_18015 [Proteobacteria bacterium]|nr:hypothetical protein [Pseudomonadota bacterium]